MKILVIVPAYNEEESIASTIQMIQKEGINVDILVINDASTDNTLQVVKDYKVTYLSAPINLGIGGAVQLGYLYAQSNGYDIAIQMDGDGQHPAEYLKLLIEPLVLGTADIAIGSRFLTKEGFQSTSMRRFGIKFLSELIYCLCSYRILDVTSGFRAVNRKYIEIYAQEYAQDYPEPEAIVQAANKTARIVEVPVIMKERAGGRSSISPRKSIHYMFKVTLAIIIQKISK